MANASLYDGMGYELGAGLPSSVDTDEGKDIAAAEALHRDEFVYLCDEGYTPRVWWEVSSAGDFVQMSAARLVSMGFEDAGFEGED
jgi:hypothetical protein